MAINQAIFSNPVVWSDVAIIQIGSSQIAKTAMPQNSANPKETRGIRARSPMITKMINAKLPNIFMIHSNSCGLPFEATLIDTIMKNT